MTDDQVTDDQVTDDQVTDDQVTDDQVTDDQVTDDQVTSDETISTRINRRKVREGLVVSVVQDKTAVVETVDRVRHRRYGKTVQRTKKLQAHDEDNQLSVGDRVRIQETRPLSKTKRWRLVEVLERAK
jgi:small subunit ribosomal protein S17